jgi:hypothetical protein
VAFFLFITRFKQKLFSTVNISLSELRTESQVVKSHKGTMGKNDPVKETHVLRSSVENTLTLLVHKLNDKRKEARRPEEIAVSDL